MQENARTKPINNLVGLARRATKSAKRAKRVFLKWLKAKTKAMRRLVRAHPRASSMVLGLVIFIIVLIFVVVSAWAISRPVTLSRIDTMQEMTSAICENSSVNETARLRDERDGKYYWVAKLADGNCWMTQNLDFDLTKDTVLEPETSDVKSTVVISDLGYTVGFFTRASNAVESGVSTEFLIQTWDLGDYVIIDPTNDSDTTCAGYGIYTLANSNCSDYFVNVKDLEAREDLTDYTSGDEVYDDETYDAHYLVGNYYSWNAATAGSGATTGSYEEATDSICPAGWQLPPVGTTSDTNYNTYDGSFYNLLDAYGLAESTTNSVYDTNIALDPLYFVRGGYVLPGYSIGGAGDFGSYWSRVLLDPGIVFALFFTNSSVSADNQVGFQTMGFPVRCVAVAGE